MQKGGNVRYKEEALRLERLKEGLQEGKPAREVFTEDEDRMAVRDLFF